MVQQNIQCCHGKFWGHLTVPDLFVGSFIIRANPLTLVPQPCTEGVYQTSPAEFMVDFRTPIDSHGKKCFFLRFLPDISELWKRISMRRLIIPSLKHPETNSIWFWKFDEHRQNTKISQEGKSSEPNSLLFRGKLAVTLVPRCDLYTFFLHSYGKKKTIAGERVNHRWAPAAAAWLNAQAMRLGVGDRLHCQARTHQWMEGRWKTDSRLGNPHEGDKTVMDGFISRRVDLLTKKNAPGGSNSTWEFNNQQSVIETSWRLKWMWHLLVLAIGKVLPSQTEPWRDEKMASRTLPFLDDLYHPCLNHGTVPKKQKKQVYLQ